MRIDSRDKRNTASDWPQGLANGHLFTHSLVEESKGENELCKQNELVILQIIIPSREKKSIIIFHCNLKPDVINHELTYVL